MADAPAENEFDYVESSGWKPKPGDVIEGEVVDISEGYSDFKQESYPILTIQPTEGDPVDVHGFHEVLRKKILQLRPAVGEKIGIKFLGKKKKKNGKGKEEVATYIVRVKGRRQTDPYARMVGTALPAANHVEEPDEDEIPY